jgi:hypothetical protein
LVDVGVGLPAAGVVAGAVVDVRVGPGAGFSPAGSMPSVIVMLGLGCAAVRAACAAASYWFFSAFCFSVSALASAVAAPAAAIAPAVRLPVSTDRIRTARSRSLGVTRFIAARIQ